MSGIMSMLLGAVSSAITDVYFNLVTLLLPGNGTNGARLVRRGGVIILTGQVIT